MAPPDSATVASVLSRRHELLGAICDSGTRKHELVESLAVSRSTIDRGLRELQEVGLVVRDGGAYRRTAAGTLALEEYDAYRRTIGGIGEAAELLSGLPADAELDAAVLDRADVRVTQPHTPYQPISHFSDVIQRASRVSAVASGIIPQQVEAYRSAIRNNDLSARFVVTDAVIEHLVDTYGDALSEALATGRAELRLASDSLPYGLLVAETPDGSCTGLILYADFGVRGTITNDRPDAVSWARRAFEEQWERATPLSPLE